MKLSRPLSSAVIRDLTSLFRLWPTVNALPSCSDDLLANYTSAISKYPELAIAYAGRAHCLLNEGNFKSAVDDISKAMELAQDQETRRYFRALLVRCLYGTVSVMSCKVQANEAHRNDVTKSHEVAVRELEGMIAEHDDWAAQVLLGETICETSADRALKLFQSARTSLDREVQTRSSCQEVLLSPDATDEVKLFVRSWFTRVDYSCNQTEKSLATTTMRNALNTLFQDLKQPVGLKAYGSKHKLDKLTEVELESIVRIIALSHIADHGFTRPLEMDMTPHKLWDGEPAVQLRDQMEQFTGNVTLKNSTAVGRLFRRIAALESTTDSYNTKAALELVKTSVKEKSGDHLSKIISVLGEPQTTAITKGDVEFFELLQDIDKTYAKIPLGIPGGATYLHAQKRLALDLLDQQHDRIVLGQAIAHTVAGNQEEALRSLTGIVQRNRYLGMHKVFEARAQLAKAMGHVEMADADFKELNRLRVSALDIPKFDNNRKREDEF